MNTVVQYEPWSLDEMIEVRLNQPDDFSICRETLERMGISSKYQKVLYPSCLILFKKNRYWLCHYKEMFGVDGGEVRWTRDDIQRRNRIIGLLHDWGIVEVVEPEKIQDMAPLSQVKILSHKEKPEWRIEKKYTIGAKKKAGEETPT